jgi:hypothetical protein
MFGLSVLSRVTLALSGFLAGFQRRWLDMSGFLTPQRLDFLGGYKRPPCLSSRVGHSVQLANILRHSHELPTSLLQASFKSKLPRRDLSFTLEWPTRSSTQALHQRSPCVRYSWRFVPLDRLWESPRLWWTSKSLYCPLLWGFDSGNRTRSWWSFGVD